MGKANVAVNQWLSDDRRFADLFNGLLFGCREVIRPEELECLDRETDVLIAGREKKEKSVQRYRDIVKRWEKGATLTILACETQEKVHYAMPVRNMLYDSLTYTDQIRQRWKQTKREREEGNWRYPWETGGRMTGEEYLSRFRKGDKIQPVITLVFYYDLKKWDGAWELYDLFQIDGITGDTEMLRQYLPNYHINLVDAGNMGELGRFHTDLQQVFGMLKCRGKREELQKYLWENEEYFREIDVETYQALRAFLHSEKLLKDIEEIKGLEKEGKIDMCQAMEEWYADALREGRERGMEEGRENGIKEGIKEGEKTGRQAEILLVVKNMLNNGFSAGDIEKYTGISGQEIETARKSLGK